MKKKMINGLLFWFNVYYGYKYNLIKKIIFFLLIFWENIFLVVKGIYK